MQAIILAAGMGKRLKELTKDNTKCMVKVNGVTLIERLLRMLDRKNLSRIVIVVGYQGKKLIDYIDTLQIKTDIVFVDNPIYNTTNNIYSLALAGDYLEKEDTLLFESDLIFEESIVDALLGDPRDTLAVVDKLENWMDGTCMVLDEKDSIADFIPGKYVSYLDKEKYYKTVNIYKFSQHFSANTYVPFLEAYRKAKGENEYYESVIKLIAMLETDELKAMRLQGQVWYEIDDVQDLDIAETLFAGNEKDKYAKVTSRYGGYWRYPKLLDFCYLVNPYFPTPRMMEEMEANFDTLVRNYPSGMAVNSLLAGRNFGVKKEHIVIGNGAAELIKELLEDGDFGKLGMIRPTFEEYPNRYDTDKSVFYMPQNEDFSYTAEDLITFFEQNEINSLVLINPDNPSGNYIVYSGLMKLIDWAKQKGINLIIDESFADFADTTEKKTLIDEEILSSYDGLYVVKSISKSYGVPGIRLGVLASGNEQTIAILKKRVAIWNINSVGEFFMQIYEKYEKDYLRSLEKIIESRKQMLEQMELVPHLRTIPSQANYVMCEILDGISGKYVAEKLIQQDILIKELTTKIQNGKQYIRIAVRNREDNERLVKELKNVMKKSDLETNNNRWHEVWNNRKIDLSKLDEKDEYTLYKELKRLDGFDVNVNDSESYYRGFYNSIVNLFESRLNEVSSIYEVGCGSGANLVLFDKRGVHVGGIDYSDKLIEAAGVVLPNYDIVCGEAVNLPTTPVYDVVISDSVFAYFESETYAMEVLEKMYEKADKQIILLEIFDKEKKEECLAYRKASVENYDEVYKGLDKIFYARDFFEDFAQKHNCEIEFTDVVNDYYWNSKYMYNCFITKRKPGNEAF